MPLQVVQAKATIPKPSASSSLNSPASSKYSWTALDPGASDVLTQDFLVRAHRVCLFGKQACRDHVPRVARIRAACNSRDDHGAVRHLSRLLLVLACNLG